jgi:hypothetical protein
MASRFSIPSFFMLFTYTLSDRYFNGFINEATFDKKREVRKEKEEAEI